MKKVHLISHQDGDSIQITEIPWWSNIYEWLVNQAVCPCHGLSGWLSRSEKLEVMFFKIWNKLLGISYKREKELYSTPIPNFCVANAALFGSDGFCWMDECEIHNA